MARKFANNAFSLLAAGITDVATTLTVTAGEGAKFPSPGAGEYFMLALIDGVNTEIVKVTARTTDSMTIVRAQEGTVASAFSTGAVTSHRLTAEALTAFEGHTTDQAAHSSFAAGTKMLFAQTAAPTGWTKDTTHNDKALRVVSGTAGSGGSVAFTTAFASKAVSGSIGNTTDSGTVGGTTLSTAQIPSHTHTHESHLASYQGGSQAVSKQQLDSVNTVTNVGATGGGGSHTHGLTMNAHNHTFTGTAIDMAVQYVDIIIATKD